MLTFTHDGFEIAYLDVAPADRLHDIPVLLIHGFASSVQVNWVAPGWVKTLVEAGYRVIAFDNRGHGLTSKSYEPADYTPEKMASDGAALLQHLDLPSAHVMGYSMGARISAFLALAKPEIVRSLVLGGLGIGMVEGVGDWDPIASALMANDPGMIEHPRGKMFRLFADQTKSDRRALAACIMTSRTLLEPQAMAMITQPTLVAVGTKDDIGGSPQALADLMPNAVAFDIEGRDHMVSVGDRTFKKRVVDFLGQLG